MTAIWLLSTRGRPEACQQVLDACEETGMTSPGVVYVDETVDEYQDISPLQQRLINAWLGSRQEICVVGDPAQTIYSF